MTTLETTDPEQLEIILQHMRYKDILDLCHVNSDFFDMCYNDTSVVGEVVESKRHVWEAVERKRQEDVMAEVTLEHDLSGGTFGISIVIPHKNAAPSTPEIYINGPFTTPIDVEDMIEAIVTPEEEEEMIKELIKEGLESEEIERRIDSLQNIYRMAHAFDVYRSRWDARLSQEDQRIVYERKSNTVKIYMDAIEFGVNINAGLFKAILEDGLRAYNRGIDEGTIMIFADLDSRLVLR